MIVSRRWLARWVAAKQCHHRDATSKINFYILNLYSLVVTDSLTLENSSFKSNTVYFTFSLLTSYSWPHWSIFSWFDRIGQFLAVDRICLLTAFVFCLLTAFVFWPHLSFDRICLLTALVFWPHWSFDRIGLLTANWPHWSIFYRIGQFFALVNF